MGNTLNKQRIGGEGERPKGKEEEMGDASPVTEACFSGGEQGVEAETRSWNCG